MDQSSTLSVDEVASLLNVTPRTVRNLIKRGRFPGTKKIDPLSEKSTYQIPRSDVDKYIDLQNNLKS